MAWNPETYNQFKKERYTAFYDLIALLDTKPGMEVIDLGCGTGELTRLLADELTSPNVLGIDNSAEMLERSKLFATSNLQFKECSIEEILLAGKKWDLLFSNAAIQWVDNHQHLFSMMIGCLKENGQLLIQLPAQNKNITNQLLWDLAAEEPFKTAFNNWNLLSPVLDTAAYADLLFYNGSKSMNVFEKIYPLVLTDTDALYNWVSGTALIPYIEKLPTGYRDEFIEAFKKQLRIAFPLPPLFYPFKRILIEAKF